MKGITIDSQYFKAIGVLLLLSTLGACATATNPEAMAVRVHVESYKSISSPVLVVVGGGSETSSMGASQISNADFQSAIVESIHQTGLFSQVIETATNSSYTLRATIVDIEQPVMGFSMTVNLEVAWSLSHSDAAKPIWQQSHHSTYTAAAGEAFAGVTRLRLATEGAARENISWALDEISKLEGL